MSDRLRELRIERTTISATAVGVLMVLAARRRIPADYRGMVDTIIADWDRVMRDIALIHAADIAAGVVDGAA